MRTLIIAAAVVAVAGGIGLGTASLLPQSDSAPLQPITVHKPEQTVTPADARPPTPAPAAVAPRRPTGLPVPPPPVTRVDDDDRDDDLDDDRDDVDDDLDDDWDD